MSSATFDDMHDRPEEFSEFAALPLEACRSITTLYDSKDQDALKFQSNHVWLTRGAASFGTLAVIAAIFGLSHFWISWVSERQLATAELTVVFFAFSFAVYGLATSQKYKWLARRHQAELYRQLKFRFLIRPAIWQDADWLSQEKKKIEAYTDKSSLEEGIEDALPHGPFPITEEQLPRETFEQLVQYYMKARLRPQMLYLDHRAQRNEYKDRFLAFLPAGLFFGSVAAAAAHSGFSYFSKQVSDFSKHVSERPLSWAIVAALLAACLPVTAAWVRTVRAAFEYSRNKSRSIATHRALLELEDLLVRDSMVTVQGGATPRQDVAPRNVLEELWWCEQIFATEHIEWLRLMVETEWYG